MKKKLKRYRLKINPENGSMVDFISQVEKPAIEVDFLKFEKLEDSIKDYPQGISDTAKRVLAYVEKNGWGSCGTGVGKQRANQLANGEAISMDTVKRMYSYLSRHKVDLQSSKEYGDGCGKLMYDAWGGDAALTWSERKLSEKMSKQEIEMLGCPPNGDGTKADGTPDMRCRDSKGGGTKAAPKAPKAKEAEKPRDAVDINQPKEEYKGKSWDPERIIGVGSSTYDDGSSEVVKEYKSEGRTIYIPISREFETYPESKRIKSWTDTEMTDYAFEKGSIKSDDSSDSVMRKLKQSYGFGTPNAKDDRYSSWFAPIKADDSFIRKLEENINSKQRPDVQRSRELGRPTMRPEYALTKPDSRGYQAIVQDYDYYPEKKDKNRAGYDNGRRIIGYINKGKSTLQIRSQPYDASYVMSAGDKKSNYDQMKKILDHKPKTAPAERTRRRRLSSEVNEDVFSKLKKLVLSFFVEQAEELGCPPNGDGTKKDGSPDMRCKDKGETPKAAPKSKIDSAGDWKEPIKSVNDGRDEADRGAIKSTDSPERVANKLTQATTKGSPGTNIEVEYNKSGETKSIKPVDSKRGYAGRQSDSDGQFAPIKVDNETISKIESNIQKVSTLERGYKIGTPDNDGYSPIVREVRKVASYPQGTQIYYDRKVIAFINKSKGTLQLNDGIGKNHKIYRELDTTSKTWGIPKDNIAEIIKGTKPEIRIRTK